jgi:hypothetical protein
VWYPSLEPVLTRLATRVRWWQLGGDLDRSFVDCPNLTAKIGEIKDTLDRIGQDVNVGMGWGWVDQFPKAKYPPAAPASDELLVDPANQAPAGAAPPEVASPVQAEKGTPWRFLALSATPPMTYRELERYVAASGDAEVKRWAVLQPISARDYTVEVRATDLVNRMIAARIQGADAIFCPNPFDDEHGLMNADGTPGELLLPWRTAAMTLGGAEYIGSMQLPGGSQNQVFARKNDAAMIVWNERPTDEVLYLGAKARQVDLWGHEATPEQRDHRQVIHVERVPKIVTGLDLDITRWRLAFSLARYRLPSVFGRPHSNEIRMTNTFERGVAGKLEMALPEKWQVQPRDMPFRLAEGEPIERPFEITFPYDANAGRHQVHVDFEIQGTPPRRFSVYRNIDVGLGFVYITIRTWLNDQGELEVEQKFVNDGGGRVSFRCQLFIPERRRQMIQVLSLPKGQKTDVYRIPDGEELIGQTLWLRAEELKGPRVLNYRFEARK